MASLLAPFSFGQRQAYFALELTIHELRDVPLVTGNFQAKWRIEKPHVISSNTGGSSNLSRLLHHAHEGGGEELSASDGDDDDSRQEDGDSGNGSQDDDDDDDDNHRRRGDSHAELALPATRDHAHAPAYGDAHGDARSHSRRRPSAPSSNGTSSPPRGFLSHLFHRRQAHHDEPRHHSTSEAGRPRTSTSSSSTARTRDDKSLASSLGAHLTPQYEPRGATDWHRVHSHSVKWEKTINAGVRIPLDKPRQSSSAHGTSAQGASVASSESGSHDKGLRSKSSSRSLREDNNSRDDMSAAWGCLGDSQIRIIIRQDIATDSHTANHPHQLGVVHLNLAEHAPCPRTHVHEGAHSHAHAHHHHHLHHHHHHRHSSGSARDAPPLQRSETRRFLLQESKTNASLEMTITMTHIGGSREYTVPPVRCGLVVGSLGGIADEARQGESHSSDDAESKRGATQASTQASRAASATQSTTSLHSHAARPRSQVSQHLHHLEHFKDGTSGRIPSSNLKDEFRGSAMAPVKMSGIPVSLMNTGAVGTRGERTARLNGLQYHFSGASSWERNPEDIVEALFTPVRPPHGLSRPSSLAPRERADSHASSAPSDRKGRQTVVASKKKGSGHRAASSSSGSSSSSSLPAPGEADLPRSTPAVLPPRKCANRLLTCKKTSAASAAPTTPRPSSSQSVRFVSKPEARRASQARAEAPPTPQRAYSSQVYSDTAAASRDQQPPEGSSPRGGSGPDTTAASEEPTSGERGAAASGEPSAPTTRNHIVAATPSSGEKPPQEGASEPQARNGGGAGWRVGPPSTALAAPASDSTTAPEFEVSRPSSPFPLGLGLTSPRFPNSPPDNADSFAKFPSFSFATLAADEDARSLPASRQPSLDAYVHARLSRPRSKVGLRSKSARSPSSSSRSRSEVPEAPALIPGSNPTRHAPEIVVSGAPGPNDNDEERRRPTTTTTSRSDSPGVGLAWADAQTELEAQRGASRGRGITGTTTSLLPPPLSALYPSAPSTTPSLSTTSSAASSATSLPKPLVRSSPSPTPSSKTLRRLSSASTATTPAPSSSRSRSKHGTRARASSQVSAAASLLEKRPGGIPLPASYLVRKEAFPARKESGAVK
ncbi:unnamed protein product [Parajaminaea phylloscopi]